MINRFFLSAIVLAFMAGCGNGSGSSDEDAQTSGSSDTMVFDVLSSGSSISGGSGHYSVTYQASKKANGAPVSGLDQPSVSYTLYENDFEISESRLFMEPNPKSVSNHILLMLDFSASVVGDCEGINISPDGTLINPYEGSPDNLCTQLVLSAQQFVDTVVKDNQSMAIYYFNSQRAVFPLISPPVVDKGLLKERLALLFSEQFRREKLSGYIATNLNGAVVEAGKTACQWVDNCNHQPRDANPEIALLSSVVVFTDGRDTASLVTEKAMFDSINSYPDNFYYSIGLGNVDDEVMAKIGRDGFFKVDDVADLNAAFADLGVGLESWANSFYKVDFCPTQQTGKLTMRLKIVDAERGLRGELSEDFNLPENIDLRCDL